MWFGFLFTGISGCHDYARRLAVAFLPPAPLFESIELFPAEMFGRKLSSISFSRKAASYAAAFDARGMDMRRLQHFLGHADHGTKCQQRPMTGLMHCSITRSLDHLVGAWAQIKMQGH
jgi:hypothetical protein